jgi:hypothetical protein
MRVYPVRSGSFRWRVRAKASSAGAWSVFRSFTFNKGGAAPAPAPSPTPTTLSAPTGRSQVVGGGRVTFSWSAVGGASGYDVHLQEFVSGAWRNYYTWSTARTSFTAYPVRSGTFRWRVRAKASSAGTWSFYRSFSFTK